MTTKTLRVELADLEGIPHGGGRSGMTVTVTARYTGPVVLTDGRVVPQVPKASTMGTSGRVNFTVWASDSTDVREDHRGFAVQVTATVTGSSGSGGQYVRTVKPLSAGAATVRLGDLPAAEGLPPQWVTVEEVLGDFDGRLDGLSAALDGKAAAGHAHTPADIGAEPELTGTVPYVTQDGARADLNFASGELPTALAQGMAEQAIGIERLHDVTEDLRVKSWTEVLENPTTIPTTGAARLDLVFTEPTTVTFEQPDARRPEKSNDATPGLSDIVLSIEGYEHVTWDNAVVHGTPDQSGVVWASALWRQRDSTWHLLCEQDPAQGSGLGVPRLHKWTVPFIAMRDKSPEVVDDRGFVVQEEYVPFPGGITYGDVVIDLADPDGGPPITTYVDTPVYGYSPPAFNIVSTEAVFRTPDSSSYVKFRFDNFRVRGGQYLMRYTVKVKGSPLRANTYERFDHPMITPLATPGIGHFILTHSFHLPGYESTLKDLTLTVSRPGTQPPRISLSFRSSPAVSFPEEVIATGEVGGIMKGNGHRWSLL